MLDNYRELVGISLLFFVISLSLILLVGLQQEGSNSKNQELKEMEPMPVVYGHFFTKDSWSSEDGWTHVQTQKNKGNVVNNTYRIDPGETEAYFAVKFKGGTEFNRSAIRMDIPKPRYSGAEFVVATSTEQDKKIDTIADPCDCIVYREKLQNGVNNINLSDILWKNYTYFKVDLKRSSPEVQSPSITFMEVE